MKTLLLAAGLLLLPGGWSARAEDVPPVPRAQMQTFALAYTLRTCDLRAQKFVQSVKALKDAEDDAAAGAEVVHLSKQAANLRRRQAAAYTQIASLLDQMDAPPALRRWSAQTAASLTAPLLYSTDAQALAKTEPDSAATLAEIVEVQAVKAQADMQQPSLNAWLTLTGGKLSLWTADVGTYAAGLDAAKQLPPSPDTARRLLLSAPAGAPSEVRGDLSELVPRGGGNLQALATVAPAAASPRKMTEVAEKLRMAYNARALTADVKMSE